LPEFFSGKHGIDPYTTAVSGRLSGSFCEAILPAKVLYDVDAFEAALADRVPENSLLSHDLFESLFRGAALATDIELLDDSRCPTTHTETTASLDARRLQICAGSSHCPHANGRQTRNPLPLISSWKILDNLRRSLVAPAMFLCYLRALDCFPGLTLLWSLFIVITIAFRSIST